MSRLTDLFLTFVGAVFLGVISLAMLVGLFAIYLSPFIIVGFLAWVLARYLGVL